MNFSRGTSDTGDGSRLAPAMVLIATLAYACGPARRAEPPPTADAQREQHERAAAHHESQGIVHSAEFDPMRPDPARDHEGEAYAHWREAARHRGIAESLLSEVDRACRGVPPAARGASPFDDGLIVLDVEPSSDGARLTVRAPPGTNAEWLETRTDCHIAYSRAQDPMTPEFQSCPLAARGVNAVVEAAGSQFIVTLRSPDPSGVADIRGRAAARKARDAR